MRVKGHKAIFFVVSFFLFSCQVEEAKDFIELDYSHQDSLEAKLITLWSTGEVFLDESLFDKILYKINYLRYQYRNDHPILDSLRFNPNWVQSCLIVKFNDSTYWQVANGTYTGWEHFEPDLQPSSVQNLFGGSIPGWFILSFDGIIHALRLEEMYQTLPGVVTSQHDAYGFRANIYFDVYPSRYQIDWSLLLIDERPFEYTVFYYFEYDNNEPNLLEIWNTEEDSLAPGWWNEALSNLDEFNWD